MSVTMPTIGANHANGDIITATNWNNDVVQQGQWVQQVIAGTNPSKIPATAIAGAVGYYPNLLVNGGMEISQRGTGAFTATPSGVMSLDRWLASVVSPATLVVQQSGGSTPDTGSAYCVVLNYTHSASCFGALTQNIENYQELRGRPLTLTARVLTNAANAVLVQLADGVTAANSSFAAATGSYVTISCTLTPATTATKVTAAIYTEATVFAYVDNVMLVAAPTAINYTPRTFAEEMTLCQRYYQKVNVSARWRTAIASEIRDANVCYPQPMPGTPTATLTAGTRANITSGSALSPTTDGARVEYTATAATTDTSAISDIVTLEYNI